ncbi:MAG TPA: hypothetical protein DEV93_22135 [Chloroflexi bacterium]|nr:hypothetical protein [Chloroflexota bacterium]
MNSRREICLAASTISVAISLRSCAPALPISMSIDADLAWQLQDGVHSATHLLHDRDGKFWEGFDAVFTAEGVKAVRLPFRIPRANAYAERWVGTVRREVLDQLLTSGPASSKGSCRSSCLG